MVMGVHPKVVEMGAMTLLSCAAMAELTPSNGMEFRRNSVEKHNGLAAT